MKHRPCLAVTILLAGGLVASVTTMGFAEAIPDGPYFGQSPPGRFQRCSLRGSSIAPDGRAAFVTPEQTDLYWVDFSAVVDSVLAK